MSTYSAFNQMMVSFFSDLAETFEEYSVISDAKTLLDGALSLNSDTDVPMKTFVEVFKPHEALIMAKDPSLFDVCEIPMISAGGFDMASEWKTLEDDNKEAIWGYIQQLFLTGNTVLQLDPKMLGSIETFAATCLKSVEDGSMTAEDAQDPMKILQMMMANPEMMASFGGSGEQESSKMAAMLQDMTKK